MQNKHITSVLFAVSLLFVAYKISSKFRYFNLSEFADRYSGKNKIDLSVVARLDKAREIAGIPFFINSGYRDEQHPESLKNPTSSHIKGVAFDIETTPETQEIIYNALKKAGFIRLGVGKGFIHADMDYSKDRYITWFYDGRPTIKWS